MDLWWIKDSAKFYKIINSLLKYKVRGKYVKGIWDGDEILFGKQKREKVKLYLEELYRSNTVTHKIQSNSIFDFIVDIDRAMISIARNKAVGYDLIPGEM